MQVWTNADKPEEAAQARGYGAQGIGLCRTEHMFREGERLEIVRDAILVANQATRAKDRTAMPASSSTPRTRAAIERFDAAMAKLEVLQQGDFEGIFRAMDGLPVVIRLIDPPLHEFLPNLEEQLVKVTKAECGRRGVRGGQGAAGDDQVDARAEPDARPARLPPRAHDPGLREDPDAGHPQRPDRGQEGRRQPDRQDHDPARRPRERARPRPGTCSRPRRKAVEAKAGGVEVDYKFGTMIEVPRGALTADEIAKDAAFFSFGTNDLTQMTFGYSRDDAEGGFLLKYVEDGILPVNPFQTLDDAVAGLMQMAVDKGRATRPDIELGICGEHGGDPASIFKCERIGLDYVSCSPFRVPVARLAAAQATAHQRRGARPVGARGRHGRRRDTGPGVVLWRPEGGHAADSRSRNSSTVCASDRPRAPAPVGGHPPRRPDRPPGCWVPIRGPAPPEPPRAPERHRRPDGDVGVHEVPLRQRIADRPLLPMRRPSRRTRPGGHRFGSARAFPIAPRRSGPRPRRSADRASISA